MLSHPLRLEVEISHSTAKRDSSQQQAEMTTIGMDSQSLGLLMASVGTPKEKIEKDSNSETNRTEEIPFRLHAASRLLRSFMKFLNTRRHF
jgi:hypothetical protein